jgi:hypothetical protein
MLRPLTLAMFRAIVDLRPRPPTWETLEAFARQNMQQLLERMLEEEVDGILGRARYQRRDPVDAVLGYRLPAFKRRTEVYTLLGKTSIDLPRDEVVQSK